jgi:hypothetical protein
VGGDLKNPLNLAGLSDEELIFLRRMVSKMGGED